MMVTHYTETGYVETDRGGSSLLSAIRLLFRNRGFLKPASLTVLLLFVVSAAPAQFLVYPLTNAPQLSVCKTSPNGGGPTTLDVGMVAINASTTLGLDYEWSLTDIDGVTAPGSAAPAVSGLSGFGNYPSGTISAGATLLLVIRLDPTLATGGPWRLACTFTQGEGESQQVQVVAYRIALDYFPVFSGIAATPSRIQDDKGVICSGSNVELDIFISNQSQLVTNPTYLWTGPSGAVFSPNNTSRAVFVGTVGMYTVEVRNGCGAETREIEVVNGTTPVISMQPEPFVACNGAAAEFSVDVDAAGLAADPYVLFNWFRTSGNSTFGRGSGATTTNGDGSKTNVLALTSVGTGSPDTDGSSYHVRVNNDGCTAFSSSAGLSIIPASPEFVDFAILEGGERQPNGSISFEKVIKKADGDNTKILWTLTPESGAITLQKNTAPMDEPPVLEDITAADVTVSGVIINFNNNGKTVEWTVTNTPDPDLEGVYTTTLLLTNQDDGGDTEFSVQLIAVNVDDLGQSCGAPLASNSADLIFLPIELRSFAGVPHDGGVLLSWVTGSEVNNDFFTVERSYDGIDFEAAGRVPGAGTSTVEQQYRFQDFPSPAAGLVYYRLKQTDFDGQFTYSGLISVKLTGRVADLAIASAFSRGEELVFRFTAPPAQPLIAMLVDVNGRIVARQALTPESGPTEGRLNVAQLPPGIYVLQLDNGRERVARRILR